MERFECWELDGHILAGIAGDEYVIDTGSPQTYLLGDTLKLGNHDYEGHPQPDGFMDILHRNVSPGVAGLIGLDAMSNYDVSISLKERSIEFHADSFALPGGTDLPVIRGGDTFPHIAVLGPGGRPIDAILDLGARFSYLAISDAETNFGSAWDFWPVNSGPERFPVRLYDVNLTIAGQKHSFTAGNREDVPGLPDVEIIGSEILKYFDINIALRRNLVELRT